MKDKWVQWNGEGQSPFSAADLQDFSSGQKIEFLSLLLLEEPLRYGFYIDIFSDKISDIALIIIIASLIFAA